MPSDCPHCGGRCVDETHVDAQYQTEIPRNVICRRFDVHVGARGDYGRLVQGRHPMQTSTARGAAASQLGPNAHAILALLNKQLGLSHGKSAGRGGAKHPDLRDPHRRTTRGERLRFSPQHTLPHTTATPAGLRR